MEHVHIMHVLVSFPSMCKRIRIKIVSSIKNIPPLPQSFKILKIDFFFNLGGKVLCSMQYNIFKFLQQLYV